MEDLQGITPDAKAKVRIAIASDLGICERDRSCASVVVAMEQYVAT